VELNTKDSEPGPVAIVQQQRSSRGRLIKAKNRDLITFTGNSTRQTNPSKVSKVIGGDSSDVPLSISDADVDVGDAPMAPVNASGDVSVTKISDGVPDETAAGVEGK